MRRVLKLNEAQTRELIGDAIGLAAICVMVIVTLSLPGLV